jgi:hypothetical protein
MFRLLFFGLALYIASRIVGGLFKSTDTSSKVGGASKNEPLDLADEDVIDVDFKEIKDE